MSPFVDDVRTRDRSQAEKVKPGSVYITHYTRTSSRLTTTSARLAKHGLLSEGLAMAVTSFDKEDLDQETVAFFFGCCDGPRHYEYRRAQAPRGRISIRGLFFSRRVFHLTLQSHVLERKFLRVRNKQENEKKSSSSYSPARWSRSFGCLGGEGSSNSFTR